MCIWLEIIESWDEKISISILKKIENYTFACHKKEILSFKYFLNFIVDFF